MKGVGIDILEVKRLSKLSADENKLSKIFTQNEREYFQKFSKKLPHIAGCFCAKEAVSKALKCGFGASLSPLDVEIMHEKSGYPYVNAASPRLQRLLKNSKIELSISHTENYATAICIII